MIDYEILFAIWALSFIAKVIPFANIVYDMRKYDTPKRDRKHWTWFAHLIFTIIMFDVYIALFIIKVLRATWLFLFIKEIKVEEEQSDNVWGQYE